MEAQPVNFSAIEEVAEMLINRSFLASESSFRFSEPVQKRYETLAELNKEGQLTSDEKEELEYFLAAHHILYLARIKSLKRSVTPAA